MLEECLTEFLLQGRQRSSNIELGGRKWVIITKEPCSMTWKEVLCSMKETINADCSESINGVILTSYC